MAWFLHIFSFSCQQLCFWSPDDQIETPFLLEQWFHSDLEIKMFQVSINSTSSRSSVVCLCNTIETFSDVGGNSLSGGKYILKLSCWNRLYPMKFYSSNYIFLQRTSGILKNPICMTNCTKTLKLINMFLCTGVWVADIFHVHVPMTFQLCIVYWTLVGSNIQLALSPGLGIL